MPLNVGDYFRRHLWYLDRRQREVRLSQVAEVGIGKLDIDQLKLLRDCMPNEVLFFLVLQLPIISITINFLKDSI
jgi:hypothetical protein